MSKANKTQGNMNKTNSSNSNKPKNWLESISEGSWEPELVISGLAIFALLQLPDFLWNGYQYYQYNLRAGTGIFDELLPLLIYSVFTAATYFLLAAFIIQFMTRAFWVGFIGLMSVYRNGIKYENLPYSDYFNEQARGKLGTSHRMAEKLDNVASQIFSVAFALVLAFIAVGFVYFVFFLLYNVLKLFLNPQFFKSYSSFLFASFIILLLFFSSAALILNMKRFRDSQRLAKWQFNLSWKGGSFMMPFIFKPIQFINLTFMSNIPLKRYGAFYLFFFLVFFAMMISAMLNATDDTYNLRDYYSTEAVHSRYNVENYSSFIGGEALISNAVIKEPVIHSGLMSVFIPYPKLLDKKLNLFCDIEQPADSLSYNREDKILSQQFLKCAEHFFILRIDSSGYRETQFLFTKHPKTGQAGFKTFIDISMLNPGRHTLYLKRKALTEADSSNLKDGELLSFENIIPFWVETR